MQLKRISDKDSTPVDVEERTIESDGGKWTTTFSNLPVKGDDGEYYYYYVEETPVSGYDTSYTNSNGDSSTTAADMAIASDSAEITIENTAQKQYNLPDTGGNGTQWHYIAGAVLSLLAIGLLIFKVYKRYQIGGHL